MLQRLFVYGTLAPGKPNAHMLRDVPGEWQKGWVHGHLRHDGWGSAQGYPGILVDATADPVEGYVLTSDALTGEWERLDEFEGDGYRRVAAPVRLEDGRVVNAYLYQLKRE